MSQLPMMPIFTDALIGDTMHLSTEEFGAYMLILFATWRNNGQALTDDDKTMARICRVHISRWRQSLRPALIGFFTNGDGSLHQKRLESEWNHAAAAHERQSRAGRASALKRWKTGLTDPSSGYAPTEANEHPKHDDDANQLKNHNPAITDPSSGYQPAEMPEMLPQKSYPPKRSGTNFKKNNRIGVVEKIPNPLNNRNSSVTDPLPRHQPNGNPHIHITEELSAPIQGRESSSVAGDTSPPLPTLRAGDAAPPASEAEQMSPSALDDPKVRAEAIAAFDACLSALRGNADTLAADALPPPQESDPRIAEFRARIRRLNDLASNALSGQTRTHAWEVLARADAIGNPNAIPPTLADDLNAIEALAAEAQQ